MYVENLIFGKYFELKIIPIFLRHSTDNRKSFKTIFLLLLNTYEFIENNDPTKLSFFFLCLFKKIIYYKTQNYDNIKIFLAIIVVVYEF